MCGFFLPNNHAGRAVKYLCNDFTRSTGIGVQADLINYRGMLDEIWRSSDRKYDVRPDVPWVKELVVEGCLELLEDYIGTLPSCGKGFRDSIRRLFADERPGVDAAL